MVGICFMTTKSVLFALFGGFSLSQADGNDKIENIKRLPE